MIASMIRAALSQRLVVIVLAIMAWQARKIKS